MTVPRELRIGTITLHAATAREARALADALPAALEQALRASSRLDGMASAGVVDGGSIAMPASPKALPDQVAARIVAAACGWRPPR